MLRIALFLINKLSKTDEWGFMKSFIFLSLLASVFAASSFAFATPGDHIIPIECASLSVVKDQYGRELYPTTPVCKELLDQLIKAFPIADDIAITDIKHVNMTLSFDSENTKELKLILVNLSSTGTIIEGNFIEGQFFPEVGILHFQKKEVSMLGKKITLGNRHFIVWKTRAKNLDFTNYLAFEIQ